MSSDRSFRFASRLASFAVVFSLICAGVARAEVDYVIQISVDALRGDVLQRIVANPPMPASTTYPSFHRLQAEGAFTYNARSDFSYTETVPNHISMILARPLAATKTVRQVNSKHGGTETRRKKGK